MTSTGTAKKSSSRFSNESRRGLDSSMIEISMRPI
jgi:hypothetical protein